MRSLLLFHYLRHLFISLILIQYAPPVVYSREMPSELQHSIEFKIPVVPPYILHAPIDDGESVYIKLLPSKEYFPSSEEFDDVCDFINLNYYGHNYYTSTRLTASRIDFYVERMDVIKYFKEKYNFQTYLEIGCDKNQTFGVVSHLFETAIGVDPTRGGTHRMTSDAFFKSNELMFDMIFIDGSHEAFQVLKDVHNALRFLKPNGLILMHDCNPRREEQQVIPLEKSKGYYWNGDVWRAAVALRLQEGIEIVIGDFDHGLGVIKRKFNHHRLQAKFESRLIDNLLYAFNYTEFYHNKEELLRLVTWEELLHWVDNEY